MFNHLRASDMILDTPRPGSKGRNRDVSPPAGASTARDQYTFVDYLTQGYIAVVGLVVLLLHGTSVSHWPVFVAAHFAALLVVHALIRVSGRSAGHPVADFLRQFYPMLLYGPFFWETAQLNHVVFPGFLDPLFIKIEGTLFGFQPGLEFMGRFPWPVVSEALYAAYFSYYLMIAGVALALYRRSRGQFRHYLTVSCVVFYFCYLCYIFLPVVGPFIFYRSVDGYILPPALFPASLPAVPAAIQGGPFYRLMEYIYVPFEAPGASFPSSHVAIAIVTLYFSFQYLRPIRWVHCVVVVLLCLSTVYGRYHYAVDVLGGLVCAAVLIPLGNKLYFEFERPGQRTAG